MSAETIDTTNVTDGADVIPLPTQRAGRAGLIPSPEEPMRVARMLERKWLRDGTLTVRRWRESWYRWQGSCWVEVPDADMRAWFYGRLEKAEYWFVDGRTKIGERRPWAPSKGKIANVSEAFEAVAHLGSDAEQGWMDGRAESGLIIPCRNGLLDLTTRELAEPTPLYFNTSAVPFDFDPGAAEPERWLKFLGSVWPDDPAAVSTLQEIFGYVISGARHLEKIFLIVGPRRSGKGTISTVLKALVGESNTAAPTLAGLATNFGLSPLLGKALALIPDARMPRENAGLIVEKLLMISGRDPVTVDRKHRDPWTGVIPVQFVIMSNEPPTLPDAAAAIVGRLLTLTTTESFFGREDPTLKTTLLSELPGIFNWSLAGLDRLMQRGWFEEPESSVEAAEIMMRMSSPIQTFLEERCELDPNAVTTKEQLWNAWRTWCIGENRDKTMGSKEGFARNLFTAAPGKIKATKPRLDPGGPQIPSYQGVRLKPLGW